MTSGQQDPPPADQGRTEEPSPDPTGLDLARSVVRALAGSRRRARGNRRPRGRGDRRAPEQASGSHPDDRDPQALGRSIGRLVDERGWSTDIRVHGVFSRWGELVGADVAAHSRPESYAEGRLVVRTDSTAWATQIRLLAPTVVRRLNEELGAGTVRVVDVVGPTGPSWRKGPRSARDGRGPRDTYG